MREIKFRAWDKTINHYQSVYSVEFLQGGVKVEGPGVHIGNGWASEDNGFTHDCDVVLEQYTGLKDNNGVEIYEGDLIRIPAKSQFEETSYNCFEVFYHDNECIGGQNIGFCMNRMHTHGSSGGGSGYKFTPESIKKHGFAVIGNIHQNPELVNK
ncbi:hypothetical protein NVP1206O_39 [Vibrio phage 1.206.O._10N.222.51.B10]|nr:hypothetical protein NVP1206O_39 [Vibrio phage 1.206.O._10N.222.51.B10]